MTMNRGTHQHMGMRPIGPGPTQQPMQQQIVKVLLDPATGEQIGMLANGQLVNMQQSAPPMQQPMYQQPYPQQQMYPQQNMQPMGTRPSGSAFSGAPGMPFGSGGSMMNTNYAAQKAKHDFYNSGQGTVPITQNQPALQPPMQQVIPQPIQQVIPPIVLTPIAQFPPIGENPMNTIQSLEDINMKSAENGNTDKAVIKFPDVVTTLSRRQKFNEIASKETEEQSLDPDYLVITDTLDDAVDAALSHKGDFADLPVKTTKAVVLNRVYGANYTKEVKEFLGNINLDSIKKLTSLTVNNNMTALTVISYVDRILTEEINDFFIGTTSPVDIESFLGDFEQMVNPSILPGLTESLLETISIISATFNVDTEVYEDDAYTEVPVKVTITVLDVLEKVIGDNLKLGVSYRVDVNTPVWEICNGIESKFISDYNAFTNLFVTRDKAVFKVFTTVNSGDGFYIKKIR